MINTSIRKSHILIKHANNFLIDLPAPLNLSYLWNFGSLLGLCLMIQIITGLILSIHYAPHTDLAFSSVAYITRDVNAGWMTRTLHANGASFFFLCIYLHIARGLYYGSFKLIETWNLGVTIFILSIATAFIGYLLPWGQIRFWGATVITNLFSAIPYLGKTLVEWIWGGFGVRTATLTRFFSLHFLLPFVIRATAIIHLIFLHEKGSNNPLGVQSNSFKTPFHPHFTSKDILGIIILLFILTSVSLFTPNLLSDPENFITANPLVTPTHIKPEWYFLWAYAILRSIPNKLGGVVTIFGALIVFYLLPFISISNLIRSRINLNKQTLIWITFIIIILLTWIGGCPVEAPYDTLGLFFTIIYFLSLFITRLKPDNIHK